MRARFFSIVKDISHEMLVRYCNIDYDREIAIVAEVRENEKRKLIGIGRLIIDREFKSGEYAVLVHDNYQSKGLGYKLVDVTHRHRRGEGSGADLGRGVDRKREDAHRVQEAGVHRPVDAGRGHQSNPRAEVTVTAGACAGPLTSGATFGRSLTASV